MAAISLAWQRGASAVEIDVRTSQDGQLMVIHDAKTSRIGGRPRPVTEQTAAELRTLDAGRWKDPRWAGERIPYLREVLQTVPPTGRLFIELKEGPEVVPLLAQLLTEIAVSPESYVVMAFSAPAVAACVQQLPGVHACQLLSARDWSPPRALLPLLGAAIERGCDSVNFERHPTLDEHIIESIHVAGLQAYVWTVNQPTEARRLQKSGIDAIATDRCEWLTKHLDAAPHRQRDSAC